MRRGVPVLLLILSACPSPPQSLDTRRWKTYTLNRIVIKHPPAWFARSNFENKWGAAVIANTSEELHRTTPDVVNSPWSLGALRDTGVFAVVEQPVEPSPPSEADTPLPVRPSLKPRIALRWRASIRHDGILYIASIFAGPRASDRDLAAVRVAIRSLSFLPAPPSPSPSPSDPLAIDHIVDFAAASPSHAWSLVSLRCDERMMCPARLFHSRDGGRIWTQIQIPRASTTLPDDRSLDVIGGVWFLNDRVGWLFGGKRAFVTRNGGSTWHTYAAGASVEQITGNVTRLWQVARPCPGGSLASCRNEVRTSTDSGRTWSAASSLPNSDTSARLMIASSSRAYALISGMHTVFILHVAMTSDAGRTWRSIDGSFECGGEYAAMAVARDRPTLVCGAQPGAGQQPKTAWQRSGGRWRKIADTFARLGDIPGSGYVHSLVAAPDGTLWLALTRAGLYSSTDGATWRQRFDDGAGSGFDKLLFVTVRDGWFTRDTSAWSTNDGGAQWREHRVPARAGS